jgi:iron-sulfur cluster insertion protein
MAQANSFSPQLTESDLALTATAREKMLELFSQVEDDELKAIRVFVSGGGCGGMGYGMTFTDAQSEYDCIRKEEGFDVYVDAVALNFLRGVEIDYVERPTGASFVFNNAFAITGGSGTCGACGSAGGGCAWSFTGTVRIRLAILSMQAGSRICNPACRVSFA